MSVINQMLKDLDKRQQPPEVINTDYPTIDSEKQQLSSKNINLKWLLFALLILISAFVYWYLIHTSNHVLPPKTHQVIETVSAPLEDKPLQQSVPSTKDNANPTQEPQSILSQPTVSRINQDIEQPVATTSQKLPTLGELHSQKAHTVQKQTVAQKSNHQRATQQIKEQHSTPVEQSPVQIEKTTQKVQTTSTQTAPVENTQNSSPYLAIKPTQTSNIDIATNQLNQAIALLDKGQFIKAEQLLHSALNLNPELHQARITLMSIRYGEKNYPSALAILQQGIESFPEYLAYRLLAANILLEIDKPQVAWSLIKDQTPNPQQEHTFYQFKASLAQQLQHWPIALTSWQQLLVVNPQNAKWQLGAAIAAEQTKNQTLAAKHYQLALELPGLSQASREFAQQKITRLSQ
ncbi:tetratricopeptide repeat protein [Catenovulum sp. 2E275]|uniref:tetratricopeptide repeat protein n=1 Tax=Catenovulum sp. 2E275 TaxID=2980497 RepID=UPI0021CE3028|nr:tetratricopeptide repeat protein [Catenovulum sp. 2E275]MCU4675059.1 tetratricopeptide repeat protein [Catenovulum sp. 2E275]